MDIIMTLQQNKRTILALAIILGLSGCGGDSGGSSSSPTVQPDKPDTPTTNPDDRFTKSGQCAATQLIADTSSFASQIANADYDCMSSWFSASQIEADALFSEKNLILVNEALLETVNQYQGEEKTAKHIYYLAEFIKAAYKNRHDTYARKLAPFSTELSQNIATTSATFLRNTHALEMGDEQMKALGSMLIIVDSVRQLHVAANDVFALLNQFEQRLTENYYYRKAINNIFVAMAGHSQSDGFYQLLANDHRYIDTLSTFVSQNQWALGTDSEFLIGNAARELARLIKTDDDKLKEKMTQTLAALLQQFPLGGQSDRVWVGIAEMVNAYAPERAAELGLQDAKERLRQRIMTFSHDCQGPAQILAQTMTLAQAEQVCRTLNDKEVDFHTVAKTNQQPVPDDNSDKVDVIVFKTKDDYSTYSSFLFGNTTNNGGQFLERDPSQANNVPRFVAYQNGWDDDFSILNLEHEYVHYLDGRFNQYGDFHTTMREGHIVWWLEGFAEYMYYKEGYHAALVLGKEKTHTLPEVFATSYNDGVNRIYRWGYLGVRFLFEKHPEAVEQLLQHSRLGEYKQWVDYLDQIGPIYANEFSLWLDDVTKDIDDTVTPPSKEEKPQELAINTPFSVSGAQFAEKLFFVDVAANTRELTLTIQGSGDADLYACFDKECHYHDYQWTNFTQGSNESIQIEKESDGYVKAGRYYLSISGREAFDVRVTAQAQ
ncbi:M9 family metallopeptidase [Vibrio vulnificus]|uniref:M9 family metallopeptidase n=1 Tax=Vibrio vulnificus TaxID=672 RepID=UPI0019D4AFD1|nr:M9 family metallopeptidase [Vibrio vulnificus]MBN8031507.1 M9 family metallopeptidase [Vibrio vulnificus]